MSNKRFLYHFNLSHHALQKALNKAFEQYDLSFVQVGVLLMLNEKEQLRMSDIACHLGVVPSAVSTLIERMQKKGWIQRQVCCHDNRSTQVSMTEQGHLLLPKIQHMIDVLNQQFINPFSEHEQSIILKWLLHIQAQSETIKLELHDETRN